MTVPGLASRIVVVEGNDGFEVTKGKKAERGMMKKILIIAGPNGAGKTTFAREFLPNEADCPVFVNADLIAAGISPFDPERAAFRAGRIMLEQIHAFSKKGESFAFETTLSGISYLRMIEHWQKQNYIVKLIFLSLPTSEFALARVRQRVIEGGHYIPDDVVRRRFLAGIRNFEEKYKDRIDEWLLFDNSGEQPILLDKGVTI